MQCYLSTCQNTYFILTCKTNNKRGQKVIYVFPTINIFSLKKQRKYRSDDVIQKIFLFFKEKFNIYFSINSQFSSYLYSICLKCILQQLLTFNSRCMFLKCHTIFFPYHKRFSLLFCIIQNKYCVDIL